MQVIDLVYVNSCTINHSYTNTRYTCTFFELKLMNLAEEYIEHAPLAIVALVYTSERRVIPSSTLIYYSNPLYSSQVPILARG